MRRLYSSSILFLWLSALALPAPAQIRQSTPATPQPTPATDAARKAAAKDEAERAANERRAQARALLLSLASDARSFHDQKLRARSLAKIADTLWSADLEQARTLFRKAWEAAETADQEPGPNAVGQGRANLRGEVLKLAARRDRLLAEELLQKLKTDQADTKTEHSKASLWELPDALERRLSLAKSLVRSGNIERALQFADPALGSVTLSTVDFLTLLREKDTAAADHRYAAMLAKTGGNMSADANTISLLSSYVFTPHVYLLFHIDGQADSVHMGPSSPPMDVGPEMRLAFFQTAAAVLLRPEPPLEENEISGGIGGKYGVVKRLLPLFEQYAPPEMTAALRGQFEALSAQVSDEVRQRKNEWTEEGTETQLSDQEHSLLDQLEHAKTSTQRDELYFKLALLEVRKNDLKARDYVSKIDESDFRKRAQAWVDASLAINAVQKKKIETALELARIGELTHIQRVWLLSQAAKLLAKTDHEKALSLIDDATAEARRIEGADLDRPRGLFAIANALNLVEPARAWEAIFDAIKAANSTDGFTGDEGGLTLHMNSRSQISSKSELVPDFDIEGIFGAAATDDYERAVQLARGLQGEAPRANATIAIARAVLENKNAPIKSTTPGLKLR